MNRRLRRALLAGVAVISFVFPSTVRALGDSRLELNRSDSREHIAAGFIGTTALTEFFVWRGHKPWKAGLYASGLMAAALVFKEVGVDKFASGNDLISGGIGILGSGIFSYTVRF